MREKINQQIQVAAVFKDGVARPVKFSWNGREFAVNRVNLSYSHREGRSKIYIFAVSDSANYFKMQFDSESLVWTLLETEFE